MIKNQDIICLSFTDWEREMRSNRFHMLTRFAQNNRVFLFERSVYPLWRDKHRFFKPLSIRKKDGLFIITPGFYSPFGLLNNFVYWAYLKVIFTQFKIKKPIFWFYNYRLAFVLNLFPSKLSCYHCTEDYSQVWRQNGHSNDAKQEKILSQEKKLAEKVDIIFAVSENLAKRLKKINSHTYVSANAVDYKVYRDSQQTPKKKSEKDKILGYAGNIAPYKLDFPLLYKLAETFSKEKIVLIGPAKGDESALARLRKYPNIKILGRKPVSALPELIRDFDVCLLPYIWDKWNIRVGSPLKFYEYLASGKPIVSTPFDSLREFKDLFYTAHNPFEFIEQVKKALKENDNQLRLKRIQAAKKNTWDERFKLINRIMEEKK